MSDDIAKQLMAHISTTKLESPVCLQTRSFHSSGSTVSEKLGPSFLVMG